jgi:hypothetical protein
MTAGKLPSGSLYRRVRSSTRTGSRRAPQALSEALAQSLAPPLAWSPVCRASAARVFAAAALSRAPGWTSSLLFGCVVNRSTQLAKFESRLVCLSVRRRSSSPAIRRGLTCIRLTNPSTTQPRRHRGVRTLLGEAGAVRGARPPAASRQDDPRGNRSTPLALDVASSRREAGAGWGRRPSDERSLVARDWARRRAVRSVRRRRRSRERAERDDRRSSPSRRCRRPYRPDRI